MHIYKNRVLRITALIAFVVLALGSGCGRNDLSAKVVHGAVSVGGVPVEVGKVRFVPIEGTKGPVGAARIENGQYRVESRGGVPLGKHRVEVTALRKTGRKLQLVPGEEPADEILPLAPEEYAGKNSPLVFELTEESDGVFNIELPALQSAGR